MNKSFLFLLFIFISFLSFCQEKNEISYKIISNPTNLDLQEYILALEKSNFECFRFESKSRILTFKSGVVLELFAYNKVVAAGVVQINTCFLQDNFVPIQYELELKGTQIVIQAPYDERIKRPGNEK